jgi:hypothetical protein
MSNPSVMEALGRLRQSVEFVEQLTSRLNNPTVVDRLNIVTLTGTATTDRIAYDDLAAFAAASNRVEAVLTEGDWRAVVRSGAPGAFAVDIEGPFEDAFPDEETIEEARQAAMSNPSRFWDLCHGKSMRITASIRHDPLAAGFQWVRSVDALVTWAPTLGWPDLARLLLPRAGPRRLLIHDAGRSAVICGGFSAHGPDAEPDELAPSGEADAAAYAHVWLTDDRADLPTPQALGPITTDGLEEVARLLTGLAWALCWGWLAVELRTDVSGVITASFQGVRAVDVTLKAEPRDQAEPELILWAWAVSSTDSRRREALQQAISLAVRRTEDLADAAVPVQRTARYLLQITEQGLLTEALATRRSIREAAMSLGRTTGDAARTAARSTFDRALLQVGAGFGLLLANRANAISTGTTVTLLLAVLLLTGANAWAAFSYEFPSVSRIVSAFRTDLDAYREVLTPEDLQEIKTLPSLAEAEANITRARQATQRVLFGAGIALAAMTVGTLLLGPPSSQQPASPATTITTPSAPSAPRTSVSTVPPQTTSRPSRP